MSEIKSSVPPNSPVVGVIMGSKSDLPILAPAAELLTLLGVAHEVQIVSAHRTPLRMVEYASAAEARGLKVIIAGAGGAAHLPGMVASLSQLPVVGVPVKSSNSLDGWDSVLSILQMPAGVPVATVALNAAKNAALLAVQILALSDTALAERLRVYRQTQTDQVMADAAHIEARGHAAFLGPKAP